MKPQSYETAIFPLAFAASLMNLKTAVEPLPVLHLLESTRTCSCLGFHQFDALRSSCSSTHNNALDGPKMASTAVFKITDPAAEARSPSPLPKRTRFLFPTCRLSMAGFLREFKRLNGSSLEKKVSVAAKVGAIWAELGGCL